MKKANNFQLVKVQPQGVAQFLLDFLQFQPGVAYEGVTSKQKRVVDFDVSRHLKK